MTARILGGIRAQDVVASVVTMRGIWTASVLIFVSAPSLLAQSAAVVPPSASTEPTVQVSVDLGAGAFDRSLPFDVPFFIAGRAPEGALSLDVQYAVLPPSGDISNLLWMPREPARWKPDGPAARGESFLVLVRPPLEAERRYLFRLVFLHEQSGKTAFTVEGRTSQNNYVSADAGVLYAGDIAIGAFYVGSNIYFRPVNKNAPFGLGSITRRLALTVGITVSPIADENNRTRSDLFWNQSLVLGGGYRLTSSIRGGGGALIFRESDPNPLITRKTVATTWYVSFSFDLDIAKVFATMRHILYCLCDGDSRCGMPQAGGLSSGPSRTSIRCWRDVFLDDGGRGWNFACDGHGSDRSAYRCRQEKCDVHDDSRHAHRGREGRAVDHGSSR